MEGGLSIYYSIRGIIRYCHTLMYFPTLSYDAMKYLKVTQEQKQKTVN